MVEIEDITCQTCMGQGRIFNTETNDPSERPRWRECPDCNGTGYVDDDDEEGKVGYHAIQQEINRKLWAGITVVLNEQMDRDDEEEGKADDT